VKKIRFGLDTKVDYINLPMSANKYLPHWYKKSSKWINPFNSKNKIQHQKTVKHCMPFLDAISSGYIFETWADIGVSINEDGTPNLMWRGQIDDEDEMFESRNPLMAGGMPIPDNCYNIHFTLSHPMHIKTPPGYSVLITQPFNRFDLPFVALTGIVDTDTNTMFTGNYPLFLKKNFEGIIPKGTPLFQIIPFKREDWESKRDDSLSKEGQVLARLASKVVGWYRDNSWSRKKYE
jgi:hypothetical protein